MPKRKNNILAIYKVVRNFKHKKHGWITWRRFVVCTPEYAKNHVIRRELVRCSAEKQESAIAKALWIDSIPDLRIAAAEAKAAEAVKAAKAKAEAKPMDNVKPKATSKAKKTKRGKP